MLLSLTKEVGIEQTRQTPGRNGRNEDAESGQGLGLPNDSRRGEEAGVQDDPSDRPDSKRTRWVDTVVQGNRDAGSRRDENELSETRGERPELRPQQDRRDDRDY